MQRLKGRVGARRIRHDLLRTGVPYETDQGKADFHRLRHDYVSHLIASGIDPVTVQRLARHTGITVTMRHSPRVPLATQFEAMEAVPEIISLESGMAGTRKTGTDDTPEKNYGSGYDKQGDNSRTLTHKDAQKTSADATHAMTPNHEKTPEKPVFSGAGVSGIPMGIRTPVYRLRICRPGPG